MTRSVPLVGPLVGVFVAMCWVVSVPALAAEPHPGEPSGQSFARLVKALGVIEGKLTRVDGRHETVDVSIGLLGLLGRTLQINADTRIEVDGREGRFADLLEGLRVKAFYEERGAKLVATRLEVSTG
jgi:hypothetical protein